MILVPALAVVQILWVNDKLRAEHDAKRAVERLARREVLSLQCPEMVKECRRIQQFGADGHSVSCQQVLEQGQLCLYNPSDAMIMISDCLLEGLTTLEEDNAQQTENLQLAMEFCKATSKRKEG